VKRYAHSRALFHARSYYVAALDWLAATKPSISAITLVANLRSLTTGSRRSTKSAALLRRVRSLYEARPFGAPAHRTHITAIFARVRLRQERGYVVSKPVSSSADCDLVLLAKQGCLIPGTGGFSKLAVRFADETSASGVFRMRPPPPSPAG